MGDVPRAKKARLENGLAEDLSTSTIPIQKAQKNIKDASTVDQFLDALDESEKRKQVVVANFFIEESASCKQMKQIFYQMAEKFANAVFLEVNADHCRDVVKTQGIFQMPTFVIYQEGKPVDQVKGAQPNQLEATIQKHYCKNPEEVVEKVTDSSIQNYIDFTHCECLNVVDSLSFRDFIHNKCKLISDCDEQLILSYGFNQELVLHCFKIKAPEKAGPKNLKLFLNLLTSLDFDNASSMKPAQEIKLTPEHLKGEKAVELYRVKFQKVKSLHIFITENMGAGETTEIETLNIFGAPVNKLKGIAGRTSEVVYLD